MLLREVWQAATEQLGVKPFGLLGWSGRRCLHSWTGGPVAGSGVPQPLRDICLEHGDSRLDRGDPFVWVQTSVYWPEEELSLEDWLRGGLQDLLRGQSAASARHATPFEMSLLVDTTPTTFWAVGDDAAWCAYRRHGDVGITITARDVAASALIIAPASVDDYLPAG